MGGGVGVILGILGGGQESFPGSGKGWGQINDVLRGYI